MSRIIVLHEDEAREMIETAVSRAVAAALEKIQRKAAEPDPAEGYVTRKEAAALLSCHVSTITNMEKDGKIRGHKLRGTIRYKKSDVLNFSGRTPRK